MALSVLIYNDFYRTNTAQNTLFPLSWSCLLLVNGTKLKNDELKKEIQQLVQVQAVLLTSVVAAGNEKISQKAFNMVSFFSNYY